MLVNRKRDLVNNVSMLLAAIDRQPGEIEMTIRHARKQGIRVCCVKPLI